MSSCFKALFFFILIITSIYSCKVAEKNLVTKTEKSTTITDLDQEIFKNKLSYNDIVLKNAKISITTDDGTTKLRANIKIRKDSAILISLSNSLGIEAARVLFTEDSIQFIDRMNRNFVKGKYSAIAKMYHIPFNFNLLELVLVDIHAQYFLADHISSKKVRSNQGVFNIEKTHPNFTIDYKIGNNRHLIHEVLYQFVNYPGNVLIRYSNYAKFEQGFFPELVEAQIQQKANAVFVEISFNQVSFNNTGNIVLEAPKSYKRIYL
ncbi:MAG: DUF4292 domain-containing protein [Bacteroidota bacterium]